MPLFTAKYLKVQQIFFPQKMASILPIWPTSANLTCILDIKTPDKILIYYYFGLPKKILRYLLDQLRFLIAGKRKQR